MDWVFLGEAAPQDFPGGFAICKSLSQPCPLLSVPGNLASSARLPPRKVVCSSCVEMELSETLHGFQTVPEQTL